MARQKSTPTPPALDLAGFRNPEDEAGLSLDQLNAAFAEMLQAGESPYADPREEDDVEPEEESDATRVEPTDDPVDVCELSPRTILEAMLFVGSPTNEPLGGQQVASMMRGVRATEIDALVRELNRDYEARQCPYFVDSQGAGYRLVLRGRFDALREAFQGRVRQVRLSQAAIEVLSAVAYHQPITADDVARLRGKPSGHVLTQLVRRELLQLARPGKGEPARYRTTGRFLEVFSLASLADLPRSQDLEGE